MGTTTTVDVEIGTEAKVVLELELELVGETTTVDVEIGPEEVLEMALVGETTRVEVTKTVDVMVLFTIEELLLETLPG